MPMQTLFGIETEYAHAMLTDDGRAGARATALRDLTRAVREQACWLPGLGDRAFLANGGLFYVDRGGHPELTTPECTTPWEVVNHTLAGERILSAAAASVVQAHEHARLLLLKTNVDHVSRETWGCHESYLTTLRPSALQRNLIPHLVTRIIYTGAGGFRREASGGLAFAISPRVEFLETDAAGGSTEARGILHRKNEPLAAPPYRRLHLICGESISSRIAQLLRVGTTALVVRMIENGMCLRAPIALQDPVGAMRAISADPTLRASVTTRRHRQVTAIDVQRYYLETAESCAGRDFMPPWAPQICAHWREILDMLERAGRAAVVTRLDWAMRLGLFERLCTRAGFSLAELTRWDAVLGDAPAPAATAARAAAAASRIGDQLRFPRLHLGNARSRRSRQPGTAARYQETVRKALAAERLSCSRLEDFQRLRAELLESDARFAQLGDGIYARLRASEVLHDGVEGVDEQTVERATVSAPAGRARARAAVILEHGGHEGRARFYADWDKVVDLETRKVLDLRDPFSETARWTEPSTFGGERGGMLSAELLRAEDERILGR